MAGPSGLLPCLMTVPGPVGQAIGIVGLLGPEENAIGLRRAGRARST